MSLILIALLQLSLLFRNVISTCSTTSDVEFTFYGFPDGNSDTTSFGCSGSTKVTDGTAGGSGSYANPETFATALNNPTFVPCEVVYIPLLRKYFQYMDHCEECMDLYPGTIRIDLWVGSDVNGGPIQTTCEDDFGLKTGQTIVRDPPSSLPVNAGQLWDNDSGICGNEALVFANYETGEAALCGAGDSSASGGGSGGSAALSSSGSSSTAPTSTPSTPASSANKGSKSTTSATGNLDTIAQVDTVAKLADDVKAKAPSPTTLATIVVSATPSSTIKSTISATSSSSPSPSPSSSSSSSAPSSAPSADCGVSAEWPTAWQGHCAGAPCHDFNDCSGELICQGWPNAVCTNPASGK
ncbi:MAG: hypothetical protein ALECFALPRED_009661 [Alectoria fallacina]|uniref:Uncharacterized protein n=1 Tax=Alectoria fallacina TaxID=1903189 RepID=A0A8H3II96_9LECA|nr:MAG: hypothetical protein ALECFALPRED_009661 [Alectoria fallacina]